MNNNSVIVEVYENTAKNVSKYVHASGAETTIKTVSSCSNTIDSEGLRIQLQDRNKVALFVSSSVGCEMRCGFCYLTAKKFPFFSLSDSDIIENSLAALRKKVEEDPTVRNKYLKLSYMGMGDAFASSNNEFGYTAYTIVTTALQEGLVAGLDGIDIGTSFPKGELGWTRDQIEWLDHYIWEVGVKSGAIKLNPQQEYRYGSKEVDNGRTPVRLFISLHTMNSSTRKTLMPAAGSIRDIVKYVQLLDIDVIFHVMFLNTINDYIDDVDGLIYTFEHDPVFSNYELRVLRFNACKGSKYKEAVSTENIINFWLSKAKIKFKYQVSAGSEIKAACGQFLCRDVRSNGIGTLDGDTHVELESGISRD